MSDIVKYATFDIDSGLQSLGIGILNILHSIAQNEIDKFEYEIPEKGSKLINIDMGFIISVLFQMEVVENIDVIPKGFIHVYINEDGKRNTIDIKKQGNLIIFTKG